MIKSAGEAKQMPCVMGLTNWVGSCGAFECLAWNYFWDDCVDSVNGAKHTHGKKGHGVSDSNKKGFCGFTK